MALDRDPETPQHYDMQRWRFPFSYVALWEAMQERERGEWWWPGEADAPGGGGGGLGEEGLVDELCSPLPGPPFI
jgi:hypothetical protein